MWDSIIEFIKQPPPWAILAVLFAIWCSAPRRANAAAFVTLGLYQLYRAMALAGSLISPPDEAKMHIIAAAALMFAAAWFYLPREREVILRVKADHE